MVTHQLVAPSIMNMEEARHLYRNVNIFQTTYLGFVNGHQKETHLELGCWKYHKIGAQDDIFLFYFIFFVFWATMFNM
ncbi:hypothetical protein AB205_0117800 [Aquarana catesbeiana]|uniref:Uncharacterized protein n=1 Tax=Aquarana catesbeiana TaxID=8400 RepID=A0A2G9RV04_AQUCT|nr:hypothetical protein AB205_0117800 [Aquarana catesbeiana]